MDGRRQLVSGPGKESNSQNPIESCILGFKGLAVSARDVRRIKVPFLVIIGGDDPLRAKYVEPLHKLRPDVPVMAQCLVPALTLPV